MELQVAGVFHLAASNLLCRILGETGQQLLPLDADTQRSRLIAPLSAHVVTIVAKKRIVAVYRTQFDYQLLRSNGTQVAHEGSYSDYDKLHVSEYPPEQ